MRLCSQCGVPIDNFATMCDACEARAISSRQPLKLPEERKSTESNVGGVLESPHLSLMFVGAGLRGIPAAIVMMLASQIVTWFGMPVLTTCYIGLGILVAYAAIGGLVDVLQTGAKKNGVTNG